MKLAELLVAGFRPISIMDSVELRTEFKARSIRTLSRTRPTVSPSIATGIPTATLAGSYGGGCEFGDSNGSSRLRRM